MPKRTAKKAAVSKKPVKRTQKRTFKLVSALKRAIKTFLYVVGVTLWLILFPLRPILRPVVRYLAGVREEFSKVTWPKRREAWKLTFAVIVFSIVFVLLVQLIDYGLRMVFEKVII